MNKQEAKNILKMTLERCRARSYDDLLSALGNIDTFQVDGESGAHYQVEVEIFWDDKSEKNIRVFAAVDDGGWRAFFPLANSFIVAPDGTFIGE